MADSKTERLLQVVLVRNRDKKWRDEALMSSDSSLTAEQIILGYMKRGSVEVFQPGMKEPHVPKAKQEKPVETKKPTRKATPKKVKKG